jgi:integrase
MAKIYKQPGKPNWFAAFAIWNAETNRWKRVMRSTCTSDKKQALEICRGWDKTARKAKTGKLSIAAAREIVAQVVSDIFMEANAESLPSASIKTWVDTWLQSKAITLGDESSTHERYKRIVERFIGCIGAKANRDLSMLQASDIAQFRDRETKLLALNTANLSLKVLRVCFADAVRKGLIESNPATKIDFIESREESKRRAFTMDEIRRILEACADDIEWRGLVLLGLYLGQRLGDLRKLTWRAVDLENGEIRFTAKKTGGRINLPLMQPLIDYLTELPSSDDPNAPIFPKAKKHKRTASLSNQFREILVEAGLVEPRPHIAMAKGRSGPRATSEISFHSLRHSAVTMLKAAGVSDFMAMQIVGHESSAISRQYSHLSVDDLRRAMERLPDVSATPTKASRGKKGTKK